MTNTLVRIPTVLAAGAALALGLSACSGTADSAATPTPSSTTAEVASQEALTVADGWVMAAEEGMSAAFGVLTNTSDADIVVVGASSPASSALELHETVEKDGAMVMQEVESFTVPAHGTAVLEPGANHLMFMDLTAAIAAGDEVEITLELEDGSSITWSAPAKEFTGADEEYVGDVSEHDMDGEHDMGGDTATEHGSTEHSSTEHGSTEHSEG